MRQIIFDTETTGFNPSEGHRLVEIGCVEMKDGLLTENSFHRYINPERDMPRGAYEVHGLSEQFLSDKPVFAEPVIVDAFLAYLGEAEIIAHNASFDMRFINAELERAGRPTLTNKVTDTLELARAKFPGAQNSLDALCKRYEISLSGREKHGALIDAELLALVYIELTGGSQRGLSFLGGAEAGGDARAHGRAPLPPRPQPLPLLSTAAERTRHAEFVASFEAPSLWAKLDG